MQEAPNYNESEPVRRDYVPQQPYYQQPVPPNRGAVPASQATTDGRAGPLAWSDWVRWGPIWSGFFTIFATLLVVGSLGAAIAFTIWRATPPTAFGYGWAILTGIVAYLLGGWVTSRSAGIADIGAAILNGGLVWALSLVAILLLVLFGLGNAIGFIGNNLTLLLRTSAAGAPANVAGTVAQTAWITFVSLVIGLILAIVGAVVGMRSKEVGRRVV